MIATLTRLAVLAAGAATAVAMTVAPAQAVTAACATGDHGYCGGQNTVQAVPVALALPVLTGSRANSKVITAAPGGNRRQDFDMRNPVNHPANEKVFRWAPSGVVSKWCVTEVGGSGVQLRLERCQNTLNQVWIPVQRASGFNWVNAASGLALTAAAHSEATVTVTPTGTALNKRWAFTAAS